MSIMYKLVEPVEVGIGESMPTVFVKEAERSRARTIGLTDEIERLKAENAKLRELLRDTYDCICEMYKYMDGGYAYEDAEADPAYGPILKRMRELGVETEL